MDLSIGGNVGLTACLSALLLSKGLPGWLVVIIALAAGAAMESLTACLLLLLA